MHPSQTGTITDEQIGSFKSLGRKTAPYLIDVLSKAVEPTAEMIHKGYNMIPKDPDGRNVIRSTASRYLPTWIKEPIKKGHKALNMYNDIHNGPVGLTLRMLKDNNPVAYKKLQMENSDDWEGLMLSAGTMLSDLLIKDDASTIPKHTLDIYGNTISLLPFGDNIGQSAMLGLELGQDAVEDPVTKRVNENLKRKGIYK